jgi:diadenosine tetraphosphate (Ap4A) HIT family hydrolase
MREVLADCPFCALNPGLIIAEHPLAMAIRDAYPVSPGHALVFPRRHVESWFHASPEERIAMMSLVDEVRQLLEVELRPDGYNVGINVGEASGQTVPHVHVHLIPRYDGDVDDPSGGVRLVIPERGNYRRPGHIPSAKG